MPILIDSLMALSSIAWMVSIYGVKSQWQFILDNRFITGVSLFMIPLVLMFLTLIVIPKKNEDIALALETLRRMNNDDRSVVFDYIDEYCPGMRNRNGRFSITNDVDLKLFLFGVEQRFYTTLVGSEKRIANSVISLTTE